MTMKTTKAFGAALAVVLAAGLSPAAETAAKPAAVKATGWAARAEKMALALMPQDKFNEAAGFFGPVAKKYMPTFEDFQKEYLAAKEKLPVVAKYLPSAEAAFADAKAMKVPEKYEAKKAEYVKMLEGFMGVLRMAMALSGTQAATPAK